MQVKGRLLALLLVCFLFPSVPKVFSTQSAGVLRGTVTLESNQTPMHGVSVLIVQPGRSTVTNSEGIYEFTDLPAGIYTVLVHLHGLTDERKTVRLGVGETMTLDFRLALSPIREEITVTASGQEQSTFDAYQSVTALQSLELAAQSKPSLGEVLENQPGVAKRSFGPGSSRPVIRGFDGDRVLVLQDGIPTGTLSSQSGDHGETIDPSGLERLEVVKGPATLLYGSNAVGGVVNAVTGHHQVIDHPHAGTRGYVTAIGGSGNAHAGGAAGFEYGEKHWMLWGNGSGQRTGDYHTPEGVVDNSGTRVANGSGGFGWFGTLRYASVGYGYDTSRYGVPFANQFAEEEHAGEELIDLRARRQNLRVNAGLRNLEGVVDQFNLSLNYSSYRHEELEGEEIGTVFDNKQFVFRGVFDQKRAGPLSGSFGFSGLVRDYVTSGAEALAPPVGQNALALFGLEQLDFEWVRLQVGGRIERNSYHPEGQGDRSFTGFSGAAGVFVPLWKGAAFVTNFTHSFRAPALEELYNNGPHIGNLTFEAGNADLKRERSNGIDLSLRHTSRYIRAEANYYYYDIQDFVFLAPTGSVKEGLVEANYFQGNSRFNGAEVGVAFALNPNFWIHSALDYVDAKLKENSRPLPRIPPLRGRFGFEARHKGFSVKPELVMTSAQDDVFTTETRTPGYTVINLNASYAIAQQHLLHVFSASAFNLGDRLYRNHLSFIKDLAPEIGRGVRFTYTVRFF